MSSSYLLGGRPNEPDTTPTTAKNNFAQSPISLETPIGDEDDAQLGDFIEDKEATSPSDAASITMLHFAVEAALGTARAGRGYEPLLIRRGRSASRSTEIIWAGSPPTRRLPRRWA